MELNASLAIHGTPLGFDYFGKPEYLNYCKSFYTGATDCPKMVVDLRNTGDGYNTFYTYIISENVVDCNGRPGGYFAITLRLNCFCSSITNIYNILETVCRVSCFSKFIADQNNRFRYLVKRFDEAAKEIPDLEKSIFSLLKSLYDSNPDCMLLIDNTFKPTNGKKSYFNLIETSDALIEKSIRENGSAEVSTQFPTQRETIMTKELEAAKANANAKTQEAERCKSSLKTARKRIDDLIAQNNALTNNSGISRLQDELTSAHNALNTAKSKLKTAEDDLENAKSDYLKLERQLQTSYRDTPNNKNLKPIYIFGGVFLVLILLIWVLFPKNEPSNLPITVCKFVTPYINKNGNEPKPTKYNPTLIPRRYWFKKTSIDILNKTPPLERGKTYIFTAKWELDQPLPAKTLNDLNFKWDLGGLSYASASGDGRNISILIPEGYERDTLTVNYLVNDTVLVSRDIKIKPNRLTPIIYTP